MEDLVKQLSERAPKSKVLTLPLDLSKQSACQELVQKHIERHNTLDTLILNHGLQDVQSDFENISADQWLNTFDVNIHPHFYITKAALKHMPKGSSISMNASINHFKGHPKLIDYTATKGAMVGFARALSNSIIGEKGIRVNGAPLSIKLTL